MNRRTALLAERLAAQLVVLCIQDMTELDSNGQITAGPGPLS